MARNTNRQGADFELKVMHYLAGTKPDVHGPGFGYTCLRSSGSKGAVDVVAVAEPVWVGGSDYERDFLAVQCKLTDPLISPKERNAVLKWAQWAGARPLVANWAKHETTGLMAVHFRQLTGPGPGDWLPWEPRGENR